MRSHYSVRTKRENALAQMEGSRKEPDFSVLIEPSHPPQRDKTPDGNKWLHEVKVDGYRHQLHLCHGAVKTFTRRGGDNWTPRFASIVESAK
jgi:bifunctional non-homologous end joining protein LigD